MSLRIDAINEKQVAASIRARNKLLSRELNLIASKFAGDVLRDVKLATPVVSGLMRDCWKRQKVGPAAFVVYNFAESEKGFPYPIVVEKGFRHRGGKFIKGRHMCRNTVLKQEPLFKAACNQAIKVATK